jgi:hypothetical protein
MKQLFEITEKIQPNVQFFRLLALMVIVSVIISRFPWMNALIARLINVPDLRHNVIYQPIDGEITTMRAEIANLGQVKADNVLFHFQSREGKIISFFLEAQETYEIQQQDFEHGILNMRLDRLAPGAGLFVEITGHFDQNQTYISVTSDQGTSINTDLPSFSSQVQGYATSMTSLYDKTSALVKNNLPYDEHKIIEWGNKMQIIGFSDLILFFQSEDFQTILSAVLVLSLLIGLFLPHLAWLIPIIAALGIALIANFQLSLGFIIAIMWLCVLISFLPILPRTIRTSFTMLKEQPKEGWYLFIFWLGAFMSPFAFWEKAVAARWLALPTAMIVFYLLLLISIIIPKERVVESVQNNEHRLIIQTEPPSSQGETSLENLNSTVTQITDYLKYVDEQLSVLSKRDSEILKEFRKGDSRNGHKNDVPSPKENA